MRGGESELGGGGFIKATGWIGRGGVGDGSGSKTYTTGKQDATGIMDARCRLPHKVRRIPRMFLKYAHNMQVAQAAIKINTSRILIRKLK